MPTITTNLPSPPATGPTGDRGIGAPAAGQLSSGQQSAWAQLQQTLQQYGFTGADLQALVAWAKGEVIKGSSSAQIALDLMQTPQFERRFPAIKELAAEGVAITPAEYISLEQSYAQLEHAAGLPADFATYDALIANQVSPSEYADRINKGYLAVATAPPEVIQAMQDYYGVTKGQLVGYFLNPKQQEPLLLQQAQAAQIGGAAAASGFRTTAATPEGINQQQALRLAQMGVTYQQAQQGFQKLGEERQLTEALPGQGQRYDFSTNRLLGAQFGSDAQTALQLQIQSDFEKGTTHQGVGVTQTQTGLTGAGATQR